MQPFHLAFPVSDLSRTRQFFCDLLQCELGRECEHWIDFNLYGHQITAHLAPELCQSSASSLVDGEQVPVRHFGVVLQWEQWRELADRLTEHLGEFLIEPQIRFKGLAGEQGTFFIKDPSGNALEFKSFKDPAKLFEVDLSC